MIRVLLARRLMSLGSFSVGALVVVACTTGGVGPEEPALGGAGGVGGAGVAGKAGSGTVAGAGGTIGVSGASGAAGVSSGGAAGANAGAGGSPAIGGMSGTAGASAGASGAGAAGTAGSAGGAGASGTSGSSGSSGSSGASAGEGGAGQGGTAGGSAGTTAAGSGGSGPDPSTCNQDSECSSGHCIEGNNGGKVCGKTCKDSCDDPTFRCALHVDATKPAYSICVPKYWLSCRPCELDAQCRIPGDTTDSSRCVPGSNGVGSFCATDCAFTTCQTGFSCVDKGLPNGQSAKVCVPNGGDLCTCKPFWKDRGYKTTCQNTNGIGTCKGSRSCDSGTLSDCDAPVAEAEKCDGKDSDCDGSIDEGVDCSDNLGCTVDTCNPIAGGGAACGHAPQAGSCAIDFQCFAAGAKNPANPCQTCDPAVNATAWTDSNNVACDDKDACTAGDKCVAGKCVGTVTVGDSREPNNAFAAASTALAWNACAPALSKSVTGTIYPKGDEDWLTMSFVDTGCVGKNDMQFELTPPSGIAIGYDVYVVCNNGDASPIANCNGSNPNGGGGIPKASGCGLQPASSVGSMRITLGCGATAAADDSANVYVRVYALTDQALCASYTLNYGQVQ